MENKNTPRPVFLFGAVLAKGWDKTTLMSLQFHLSICNTREGFYPLQKKEK